MIEFWVCGDVGDEIVEKNQGNVTEEETELVLDGGFVAPHTNSFGHTFRYSISWKYSNLFAYISIFRIDSHQRISGLAS